MITVEELDPVRRDVDGVRDLEGLLTLLAIEDVPEHSIASSPRIYATIAGRSLLDQRPRVFAVVRGPAARNH
jgi:hypothetical protein